MWNAERLLEALLRRRVYFFGSLVGGIVLALLLYKIVPPTYKVSTTISIQTSYFQIPLVRDFLPETYQGPELKAQREGIILQALNFDFLEALHEKYGLIRQKPKKGGEEGELEPVTTAQLELLSKDFEVMGVGPTSFMISYMTHNSTQGYQILLDVIEHVRALLGRERQNKLLKVHAAVQSQLEALAFGSSSDMNSIFASRPDLVRSEIDRLQQEIKALRKTYGEAHPKVTEIRGRLKELMKWQEPSSVTSQANFFRTRSRSFANAKVDPSSEQLFQDLLKKYHYLDVVISLDQQSLDDYMVVLEEPFEPKSPIRPKLALFLIWGVILGFVFGAGLTLVAEVRAHRKKK